MIGNSLPFSRNVAACVPLMFVRIVLATPDTDRPSSAAFGRSTRIASSGRPSSRPSCGFATPGTSRIEREHVVRDPLGLVEIVAADFDREPAVAAAAEQAGQLLVAARGARRDLSTPGRPTSTRRRSVAIWSLVRVRSVLGVS